ncbi:class I SAM-dependent methyltransferase [Tenacibaculum sp. 190524A02b]|uniref:class I SAM-dependent methyltransferase n=1 Tax=Tenacibaculum vairaonense TaxID=3137860 RepID=UPI0031FA585E
MGKNFNFFREAVKNYKTSGTLVPSSKYLAKRMLNYIDFKTAKVIVELGPGDGAITKNILKKIQPQTLLICFEINDAFLKELKKINHPQLILVKQSAEDIENQLKKLGLTNADYIVSSLPLSIIPKKISSSILLNSYKVLSNNGLFIQYQYTLSYFKKLKEVFGEHIVLDFETLNFPPAFVYKCAKK